MMPTVAWRTICATNCEVACRERSLFLQHQMRNILVACRSLGVPLAYCCGMRKKFLQLQRNMISSFVSILLI